MNITRCTKNVRNNQYSVQFDIRTIESLMQELRSPTPSQSMHTILWVQKGTGEIVIDMDRFVIEDNHLFYVKPGQALRAEIAEPAIGFLISFEKEFLDLFEKSSFRASRNTLLNQCGMLTVVRVESDMHTILESIAEKMYDEYINFHELRAEIISSFLKIFMIYISRQSGVVEPDTIRSGRSEMATIFFSLLEKHFADKKFVKDYADILAVTPGYLNKIVKEITGFTASYHIQQRLVLEAKRRTIFEGDSLKEIAYTLGFCSPAHFSKFFKSCAGTNFTAFKRTALNIC